MIMHWHLTIFWRQWTIQRQYKKSVEQNKINDNKKISWTTSSSTYIINVTVTSSVTFLQLNLSIVIDEIGKIRKRLKYEKGLFKYELYVGEVAGS